MAYFDKYGVEFSDDRKMLEKCPQDFRGEYYIPDDVVYIQIGAFNGCTELTSIKVSVDHPSLCSDDGVLFNKAKTILLAYPPGKGEKYVIPNGVTEIWENAFKGCRQLKSIIMPDTVTYIGRSAFEDCINLTSINLPDNVTLSTHAFASCISLTIRVPKNVIFDTSAPEDIGEGVFPGVANILYDGDLTRDVLLNGFGNERRAVNGYEEEDFIFSDAKKTELLVCLPRAKGKIVIPEGVKIVWPFVFWGCKEITEIYFPKTLEKVVCDADISDCEQLTKLVFPIEKVESFCNDRHLHPFAELIRVSSYNYYREEQEQKQLQEQQRQALLRNSILFFDTETTGLPIRYNAPVNDSDNWPRLVQLAWLMVNEEGKILQEKSFIIYPDGFTIPKDKTLKHSITTEQAQREGRPLRDVMEEFMFDLHLAQSVVGYNIDFDKHIVGAELCRLDMDYDQLMDKPTTCTMQSSTDYCAIPNPNGYFGYKWPSLQELYYKLFNRDFSDAHDALADITATKECFFELKKRGII